MSLRKEVVQLDQARHVDRRKRQVLPNHADASSNVHSIGLLRNPGRSMSDLQDDDDIPVTLVFDADHAGASIHLNLFCCPDEARSPQLSSAMTRPIRQISHERKNRSRPPQTLERHAAIFGNHLFMPATLVRDRRCPFSRSPPMMTARRRASRPDDAQGGRSPEGNRSKSDQRQWLESAPEFGKLADPPPPSCAAPTWQDQGTPLGAGVRGFESLQMDYELKRRWSRQRCLQRASSAFSLDLVPTFSLRLRGGIRGSPTRLGRARARRTGPSELARLANRAVMRAGYSTSPIVTGGIVDTVGPVPLLADVRSARGWPCPRALVLNSSSIPAPTGPSLLHCW